MAEHAGDEDQRVKDSTHRNESSHFHTAAAIIVPVALETLEDVLAVGHAIVDVIVQDEYTHDVVTCAPDGYRVYDTT
jgi:hypothetical protein